MNTVDLHDPDDLLDAHHPALLVLAAQAAKQELDRPKRGKQLARRHDGRFEGALVPLRLMTGLVDEVGQYDHRLVFMKYTTTLPFLFFTLPTLTLPTLFGQHGEEVR